MSISKKLVIGALTVSMIGAGQLGGYANAETQNHTTKIVIEAGDEHPELHDDIVFSKKGSELLEPNLINFEYNGYKYYQLGPSQIVLTNKIKEKGETVDPEKTYYFKAHAESVSWGGRGSVSLSNLSYDRSE